MTKIFKAITYVLFIVGIFLFYIFPANKYGWMQELDPSISATSIESSSGNAALFTFLLLILIVATQIVLFVKSNSMKERVTSAVLMVAALIFWVFKFAI